MAFEVTKCRIGARWISGSRRHEVRDPATGDLIGVVPDLGADETNGAVDAAHTALKSWSTVTAYERAALLERWFSLIQEHSSELASLLTAEQGKPLKEAAREVRYGNSFVRWYSEECKRVYGEVIPSERRDQRIIVIKQPIGVVGAITPWNFPVAMVLRKVAPALAAGCTVVLKPALETPLCAMALADLAMRAGFPDGVFNIVTGDAEPIGKALMSDARVRKLTFTGSTEVGRLLMAQSASTLKKLTLELGGNAAFIVCNDSELPRALSGAMFAKFRNAGQTCISANRFFLQREVAEEFLQAFVADAGALRTGSGSDPSVDIGPLINEDACAKVESLVMDAITQGATLLLGGKRSHRTLFPPTVITDVKPTMRIFQEEVFGPVACFTSFTSDDEAIAAANSIPQGLVHYVYTRDLARCWKFAEQLEAGMVGINGSAISCAHAPFGGIKESGFGREGGHQGLDEFLQVKYLSVGV